MPVDVGGENDECWYQNSKVHTTQQPADIIENSLHHMEEQSVLV